MVPYEKLCHILFTNQPIDNNVEAHVICKGQFIELMLGGYISKTITHIHIPDIISFFGIMLLINFLCCCPKLQNCGHILQIEENMAIHSRSGFLYS